jgi:homoserine kinase
MKSITVSVPATSANLGPGFDCLGLALGLYNEVTFTAVAEGLEIVVSGEGANGEGASGEGANGEGASGEGKCADKIPLNGDNLLVQAAERTFDYIGRRPGGLRVRQHNNIPVGSGLGSSAAAVIGGIVAANGLVDGNLSPEALLRLAVAIEGHPDNVAPALSGGLVLVTQENHRVLVEQFPIPDLQLVVVLPDFDLPTAVARAAIPRQIPLADAVFNASRLPLLLRAFANSDYQKLTIAMQDRLHQPYRLPLIPGMAAAFQAVKAAGAAAVALSGAGPSLIAFAPNNHHQIGEAAITAFAAAGLTSRMWVLPISRTGAIAS